MSDTQIRFWMQAGAIRYFCWNGTMLPPSYPSWERRGDGDDAGAIGIVRVDRSIADILVHVPDAGAAAVGDDGHDTKPNQ